VKDPLVRPRRLRSVMTGSEAYLIAIGVVVILGAVTGLIWQDRGLSFTAAFKSCGGPDDRQHQRADRIRAETRPNPLARSAPAAGLSSALAAGWQKLPSMGGLLPAPGGSRMPSAVAILIPWNHPTGRARRAGA
jgi:hypothetical protein